MKIEEFKLERTQSLWENIVKYNLTESDVHPYSLKDILTEDQLNQISSMPLGYGQTNGSIELRTTISNLYPGANLNNILVTNGSAEANFIAIWSLLEEEDEILFMLPNYLQIQGLANSFGAKVKTFRLKEELNWQPDLEEAKSQVSSKTKIISICNPNNPTGAVLNEEAREKLVKLAKDCDAWLLVDEIYRGAELRGDETPSFWGDYKKVIVNGGLAKAYALQGLRIGWLIGPKEYIERAWSYSDYTTITSGLISQKVAHYILQPKVRSKILNRNKKILNQNLNNLQNWIDRHEDLFYFIPPKAGGMAFIRYNFKRNSTELSEQLRKEKDVFIVAGECFGMDHYIRIGIGTKSDILLEGLNLIEEKLRELI